MTSYSIHLDAPVFDIYWFTALFDFYLLNVHVEILQFIVRFRIQS